jgi:hypothetical protein
VGVVPEVVKEGVDHGRLPDTHLAADQHKLRRTVPGPSEVLMERRQLALATYRMAGVTVGLSRTKRRMRSRAGGQRD